MQGWSFSLGSVFGVEIRLHWFFLLLLALSVSWSRALGVSLGRGVMLWAMLLGAVVLREIARALTAAWCSLDLRSVLLLPTGGLQTYATAESLARSGQPGIQRAMALTGPLTSFSLAAVLAGIVLAVSPSVNLLATRWVTPEHLLRTLVWLNLLLGAVNLLPAWPLDGGRVLRGAVTRNERRERGAAGDPAGQPSRAGTPSDQRSGLSAWRPNAGSLTRGLGSSIAVALVVYGIVSTNWWAVILGLGVFMAGQVEEQVLHLRGDAGRVLVSDVMLTDFSVLSASATLEDALAYARHSLQDVFPVVRGGTLVGAVSRYSILEALQTGGNSYVQGVMARTFQTAVASEPLGRVLERAPALKSGPAQMVPVLEDAVGPGEGLEVASNHSVRMVGLLTRQNVQRSLSILMLPAAGAAGGAGEGGKSAGRGGSRRGADRDADSSRDRERE